MRNSLFRIQKKAAVTELVRRDIYHAHHERALPEIECSGS
jgi:hypothetical protein